MTPDPAIVWIARLGIGCLLLYAAFHKLRDMQEFRLSLGAYRLLPEPIVTLLAWAFALTELALGVACLAQLAFGPIGGAVLLAIYTGAIVIDLARGIDSIDCGCGGPRQPLSSGLVARNVVLLAVAALAIASPGARALGWLDVVTIALGVFVNDEIILELVSVSFLGAGSAEYSLFSSDAGLGNPIPHFWMSTFDEPATVNGDNTTDPLSVGPGSHSHFNHGFTELGTYEVTYRASGSLVAGGTASGQGTYTFTVPEPGTGLLLATALGGFALSFGRRRERVES